MLEEDLSRLPARLVGQEKEVWDIWDRLRAESEFRAAIAGPLVFVGLAVWPTSRVVPVILCAAGGGLILLAAEKRRAAKGQLFEVAAAGRVSLPSIEEARERPIRLVEIERLELESFQGSFAPEIMSTPLDRYLYEVWVRLSRRPDYQPPPATQR